MCLLFIPPEIRALDLKYKTIEKMAKQVKFVKKKTQRENREKIKGEYFLPKPVPHRQ